MLTVEKNMREHQTGGVGKRFFLLPLFFLLLALPILADANNATMVISFDNSTFSGTHYEDQSGYNNDFLVSANYDPAGVVLGFTGGQAYNFSVAQNPFDPIPFNLSSSWSYCNYVRPGLNAGEMLGSDYNGTQANGLDFVNENGAGTLTMVVYNNTMGIELDRQNALFFPGDTGVICVALDAANDTTITWLNGVRLTSPTFHLDADVTNVNFSDGQRIYVGSDQDSNFYDGLNDFFLLYNDYVLTDEDNVVIYNGLINGDDYPFPAPEFEVMFIMTNNDTFVPLDDFCVNVTGATNLSDVCTPGFTVNATLVGGSYDFLASTRGFLDTFRQEVISAHSQIDFLMDYSNTPVMQSVVIDNMDNLSFEILANGTDNDTPEVKYLFNIWSRPFNTMNYSITNSGETSYLQEGVNLAIVSAPIDGSNCNFTYIAEVGATDGATVSEPMNSTPVDFYCTTAPASFDICANNMNLLIAFIIWIALVVLGFLWKHAPIFQAISGLYTVFLSFVIIGCLGAFIGMVAFMIGIALIITAFSRRK